MLLARSLLFLGVVTFAGCGSNDDAVSGVDPERSSDCAAAVAEPPAWKNARTDANAIRVVTTDDAHSKLAAELHTYLRQSSPELVSQSRGQVVDLIVEDAVVEVWVEPGTCKSLAHMEVAKEAVANEVVFMRLNEQFAHDIPRFRELGADERKSDEQRSGYLTTALLLLESIDARYLSRTLAVNYERELVQSKLDELTETFSADFEALLDQGLTSGSGAAAERIRLSLEKFASIDETVKSDGLKRMDQLITKLRAEDLRAQIDGIHQRGMAGDYAQAEVASEALARFADGDGKERDHAQSLTADLQQRARTLRTQEIESDFAGLDGSDASTSALQALSARVDAFAGTYGEPSEQTGWRQHLASMREEVEEKAAFAARSGCSTLAGLDSYTKFQFGDTDFGFSERRTRTLLIDTTTSKVAVTNSTDTPIRILSISQQLSGEDGGVISTGSISDTIQIAAADNFITNIDLQFDNEHPSATACLMPLARRTHACRIDVVTSVQLGSRGACPQTTISHTERVLFESEHLPDKYTIKLRRN